MANADKCFLNIPFKEYLKTLDPNDPASLKLASDREFENYKAIERRINNPACGGACECGVMFAFGAIDPTNTNLSSQIPWDAPTVATGPLVGRFVNDLPDGVYHASMSVSLELTAGASASIVELRTRMLPFNGTWGVIYASDMLNSTFYRKILTLSGLLSMTGGADGISAGVESVFGGAVGVEVTASANIWIDKICACEGIASPGGGG